MRCTPETCCMNELIVLPTSGEAGFEEYFSYKVSLMHKAKRLYSKVEDSQLILTYPTPPSDNNKSEKLFPLFFESPTIVARNHDFNGCFGIDITSYINNTTNDCFLDLMVYIRNHPEVTFVLFVYSHNANEVSSLYNAINQYIDIRLINIPLPNAEQLSVYTCDSIRNYCLSIDNAVEGYLYNFYTNKNLGYDSADYLARYLKTKNYNGDLETLMRVLEQIGDTLSADTQLSGFGY